MQDFNERLTAIELELDELRSRAQILDILHRYCRAADRCDERLMLSCYHEDALDDHGFYSGPAVNFVPLVIKELRKLALSVHSISNPLVQRDGDRAFVESHYSVIHRLKHTLGFTDFWHHGRYLDVFERRNGDWRIATRVIVQDGERWIQTANLGVFIDGEPNTPPQGNQSPELDPSSIGFALRTLIRPRPPIKDLWQGFRRLATIPLFLTRLASIFAQLFVPPATAAKEDSK